MQQQSNLTEESIETTTPPAFGAGSVVTPAEGAPALALDGKELKERAALLRRIRIRRSWPWMGESLFDTEQYAPWVFAELQTLLRTPDSRRWRERLLAAGTMGCLPLKREDKKAATQTLGEILANIQTSSRRRMAGRLKRAFGAAYLTAFSLHALLWVAATLWFSFGFDSGIAAFSELLLFPVMLLVGAISSVFWAIPIYPVVLPFYVAADMRRQNRIRAAAATALGRIGQPEGVSFVAQALCDKSPLVRKAAQEALPLLLPRLTSDHYGLLASDLTPNLCRALRQEARKREPASEEWTMALLQALEKVGDGQAVEPVQALTNAQYPERIRQEAERILPVLQARRRQESDPKILLRGAATPASEPEELLRAAVNSTEEKPEQLLRIPVEKAENLKSLPTDRSAPAYIAGASRMHAVSPEENTPCDSPMK